MADNRHNSFFLDKYTFQNQKLKLITMYDIEFQSLPIFKILKAAKVDV